MPIKMRNYSVIGTNFANGIPPVLEFYTYSLRRILTQTSLYVTTKGAYVGHW